MSELVGVSDLVCTRCGFMIPPEDASAPEGICGNCAGKRSAATAGANRLPLALVGGAFGALVGAAIWAGIAVVTDRELGIIALLVGLLAGQGVRIGARGVTGKHLQVAATSFALAGLVLAKYLTFAHFYAEAVAEDGFDLGPFDPEILAAFPMAMTEMLSPYDLLWVVLAVSTAWKGPAPQTAPSDPV